MATTTPALSLSGTHWQERPPGGDEEGCYSLAQYWFDGDGSCRWAVQFEDESEAKAEGTWRLTAAALVVDLRAVWEREGGDAEWAAGEAHTREVAASIFQTLYEEQAVTCDSLQPEPEPDSAPPAVPCETGEDEGEDFRRALSSRTISSEAKRGPLLASGSLSALQPEAECGPPPRGGPSAQGGAMQTSTVTCTVPPRPSPHLSACRQSPPSPSQCTASTASSDKHCWHHWHWQ